MSFAVGVSQVSDQTIPFRTHERAIGISLARGEFFAGLFILAFANGIFERIAFQLTHFPIWSTLGATFGISIFVWVACWIAVSLLVHMPTEPVTRNDMIMGAAVTAAVLVPIVQAVWIALTALGLYMRHCFGPGSAGRRAALVILAVTVPMFWSRLVFAAMSDLILQADAIMAGLIIGTERVGNAIRFAGNQDWLNIAPPCSSLANMSLAVLGWALYTQALTRRLLMWDYGWCLVSCALVIAINATRIALMGLHREHFELIHGSAGASIASFLTIAAIVGTNLIRVRGDVLAHS